MISAPSKFSKPSKIINTPQDLKHLFHSGQTFMVGGFGLCGLPENFIRYISQLPIQDLTVISNNAGVDQFGLGLWLQNRQIKKMIASYVGENQLFEQLLLNGELEVELTPQGTLAEKIRAGGAGIPAFFTATGVGTVVAENKEVRSFYLHNQKQDYILEQSLRADISLVKAYKADPYGNLIYRKSARNFNPMMATAGTITIAEVEDICEVGELDPDDIHTPGIYVQYIYKGTFEKPIEKKTFI
jgi:3-oxoacid CoA-transferase subunit A